MMTVNELTQAFYPEKRNKILEFILNENKIKRTVIIFLVILLISIVLTIMRYSFRDNIILNLAMPTSWIIFMIYGILCLGMTSGFVFGDDEYEHRLTYKSKNSESFIEE